MIRLFVAIDIPPAVRFLVHDIARRIAGARPVPRDQLHLTLRFIGEIETDVLPSLMENLATVQSPPFPLALKGVGHFPLRGKPRIVWAGITPQSELSRLSSRIDQSLEGLGLIRETRQFSPHITFARLKNPDLETLRHFLAKQNTFQTESFHIENFSLYSSKLTTTGAIHRREALYSLGE